MFCLPSGDRVATPSIENDAGESDAEGDGAGRAGIAFTLDRRPQGITWRLSSQKAPANASGIPEIQCRDRRPAPGQ